MYFHYTISCVSIFPISEVGEKISKIDCWLLEEHIMTKSLQNQSQNLSNEEWNQLQYWLRYPPQKPEECMQFSALYRKASARLAYAQTYEPNSEWTFELEQAVAKAHNEIYGQAESSGWKRIVHFYVHQFPQLVKERFSFFLTSAGLLAAGFFLAFILVMIDVSYASYFFPESMLKTFRPDFDSIAERQWDHAVVSSQIMVNNIRVAFLCFALGIFFGLGTTWVLFYNGLLIGALAALYHRLGEGYGFWAFIWPHGVIELTAIFIAGAAGLAIGYRIFVPGALTRAQALIQEGKVTIQLIAGVFPMFIIAGIIEGFITPTPLPHFVKYIIAFITLVALVLYFGKPFWFQNKQPQTKTATHT